MAKNLLLLSVLEDVVGAAGEEKGFALLSFWFFRFLLLCGTHQ